MLGAHFAITPEQERALHAAEDAGEIDEFVGELEESWSEDRLKVDSDKAWDAIHRCLSDGMPHHGDGGYPLSHTILGGRHLHDEHHVVHITAAQVSDVSAALERVDRAWFRRRFDAIDDTGYGGALDDADFAYTWDNVVDIRDFFRRATAARRAVLFTAT